MPSILLIDDTASVLAALEYCLKSVGYEVLVAGDGRTGLRLAAERPLDLIMLDLEMPLMNGVAVCRTLKADPLLSRIPVLMMTGQATQEARRQALAAGAVVVMSKPFDLEVLEATVARCVNEGGGTAPAPSLAHVLGFDRAPAAPAGG
jgi:two-component system alkaline phosphatase synthesis response regulator PhoP